MLQKIKHLPAVSDLAVPVLHYAAPIFCSALAELLPAVEPRVVLNYTESRIGQHLQEHGLRSAGLGTAPYCIRCRVVASAPGTVV